jgi:hypothetical protein
LGARANGFDLIAVHEDCPSFVRGGIDSIPDTIRHEKNRRTSWRRGSTPAAAAALTRRESRRRNNCGEYEKTSTHEVFG